MIIINVIYILIVFYHKTRNPIKKYTYDSFSFSNPSEDYNSCVSFVNKMMDINKHN